MNNIPDSHKDLLQNEAKAFCYLSTQIPDGSPQVTPIWFDTDEEHILINSAVGRVKDKNMRSRPKVAMVITDSSNPYRYIQIRGTVTEITTSGAEDHIDQLNLKYTGQPKYPVHDPQKPRVIYKIKPEKVQVMG